MSFVKKLWKNKGEEGATKENSVLYADNLNELEERIKTGVETSGVIVSSIKPITKEPLWIQKGKNIFDGVLELGNLDNSGQNAEVPYRLRSKNYVPINSAKKYTLSNDLYGGVVIVCFYDSNKTFVSRNTYTLNASKNYTFQIPDNCKYLRFCNSGVLADPTIDMNVKYQIEYGENATTYEKYFAPGLFIRIDEATYEKIF